MSTPWPGVPPEVDPAGNLGVWVAAFAEAGPVGFDWQRTLIAAGEGASGRALNLYLKTGRIRPSAASGNGCGVVFDGVLFQRADLARQLGIEIHPMPDDARLALAGYLRWGRDVFARIKGIFACVIRDCREDSLLCGRDRTGSYPLFYAEVGPTFLVSTSIDALLRYPGINPTVDPVALAGDLMSHGTGAEDTYFSAVRRLMSGCQLEIRGGTRRTSRYWDPAPPGLPVRHVREDELEQFDALLEQAVTRTLDVGRSCIYMSGGIDSVGVAAVAADICRRDGRPMPVALLMDFSDVGADETPVQRAVATRLGLPYVMRSYRKMTSHESMLEETLEWTRAWPWPVLYPSNLAYVQLSLEAKAHGCRALLSGDGGDEWLATHPLYGAELLRRGKLIDYARITRAAARSYPWPLARLARTSAWTCGIRPVLADSVRRFLWAYAPDRLRAHRQRAILAHAPAWLAPDPTVRRRLEERIARDVEHDLASLEAPGVYWPAMRPMLEASFDDDFERSRRTGLHMLHPYWDADLVDFLFRTPGVLSCVGGRTKGLVRRRLARRFPDLGFETQRKLVMPNIQHEILMQLAPRAWEKQGGAPTLASLGVVDEARLRRAMDGFFANPQSVSYLGPVWNPLNLEAWARAHAA